MKRFMNDLPKHVIRKSSPGEVWTARLLLAAIVLATVALFHVWGNTHGPSVYSSSVFTWTWKFWSYADGYGGAMFWQGWFVLAGTALLVVRRWPALKAGPIIPDARGNLVVIAGFLMHWVAMRAQQTRLSLVALDLVIWGIALRLGGARVARLLLFPCVFLLFAVPLNFLDSVMFPLRIICTGVASALLNGLGMKAAHVGSVLAIDFGTVYQFDVADAHSSIHGMLSMVILGAFLGHVTQSVRWKQWVVFVASGAAALVAVVLRSLTIGIVSQGVGPGVADWLRSHAGGVLFYVYSLTILAVVISLLLRKPRPVEHDLP